MKKVNKSDKSLSYSAIKAKYPEAVADVELAIRKSRSKQKTEAFEEFEWFVNRGKKMYGNKTYMRVYAFKGQLFRCSRLYDGKNVVNGLWSF